MRLGFRVLGILMFWHMAKGCYRVFLGFRVFHREEPLTDKPETKPQTRTVTRQVKMRDLGCNLGPRSQEHCSACSYLFGYSLRFKV